MSDEVRKAFEDDTKTLCFILDRDKDGYYKNNETARAYRVYLAAWNRRTAVSVVPGVVMPSGVELEDIYDNALKSIFDDGKYHRTLSEIKNHGFQAISDHLTALLTAQAPVSGPVCCATCLHKGVTASADGFHHCQKFQDAENACFGKGYAHWTTAQVEVTPDDLLMQEVQSLREKLKIAVKIVQHYEPNIDVGRFHHDIGTCDFQEYATPTDSAKCNWKLGEYGEEPWKSDCGMEWSFPADGPVGNGMKFCPGCGKAVAALGEGGGR